MESSLREKPERHAPRRLSDHLMLEGQNQKVRSLVDKVYSRENLKLAWERVRANQGASGADRVTIEDFEAGLGEIWTGFIGNFVSRSIDRKLCDDWRSQKEELPGKTRPLGIPTQCS